MFVFKTFCNAPPVVLTGRRLAPPPTRDIKAVYFALWRPAIVARLFLDTLSGTIIIIFSYAICALCIVVRVCYMHEHNTGDTKKK